MAERKQLSKKTRFEVFKRDGFVCQYCGAHPPESILHVDHITPVKLGGENDMDNLITSCSRCNLGKHAIELTSIPQSLKDKAEQIAESEAQIKGYQKIIAKKRKRLEADAWVVCEILSPGSSKQGIRRDWFKSISMFIERLGLDETKESMEIAASKKTYENGIFLYFCGVCWRKIRGQNG